MSITNAGEHYSMNNVEILKINSPQHCNSEVGIFGAPHVVVAKCKSKRWAIVALTRRSGDKDDPTKAERRLGIRWFHSTKGHPVSNKYCVWFILPDGKFHGHLLQALESGEAISKGKRKLIDEFLKGEVGDPRTDGEALKKDWKAA